MDVDVLSGEFVATLDRGLFLNIDKLMNTRDDARNEVEERNRRSWHMKGSQETGSTIVRVVRVKQEQDEGRKDYGRRVTPISSEEVQKDPEIKPSQQESKQSKQPSGTAVKSS
jgi:hypothetical protein